MARLGWGFENFANYVNKGRFVFLAIKNQPKGWF
jgi:hypothetical protein